MLPFPQQFVDSLLRRARDGNVVQDIDLAVDNFSESLLAGKANVEERTKCVVVHFSIAYPFDI